MRCTELTTDCLQAKRYSVKSLTFKVEYFTFGVFGRQFAIAAVSYTAWLASPRARAIPLDAKRRVLSAQVDNIYSDQNVYVSLLFTSCGEQNTCSLTDGLYYHPNETCSI